MRVRRLKKWPRKTDRYLIVKRVLIMNERPRSYFAAGDFWTQDTNRAKDFQTTERAEKFVKDRNLKGCSIVEVGGTETQVYRRNLNEISDPPFLS